MNDSLLLIITLSGLMMSSCNYITTNQTGVPKDEILLNDNQSLHSEELVCKNTKNFEKITKSIDNILSNNQQELKSSIQYLHLQGLIALPVLIERISEGHNLSIIDLHNPISSYYEFRSVQTGVILAYLVELILVKDVIVIFMNNQGGLCFNHYLFNQGLIKYNGQPMESDDLVNLQTVYANWWSQNESKSLKDLQNEYSTDPPLKKSNFSWY